MPVAQQGGMPYYPPNNRGVGVGVSIGVGAGGTNGLVPVMNVPVNSPYYNNPYFNIAQPQPLPQPVRWRPSPAPKEIGKLGPAKCVKPGEEGNGPNRYCGRGGLRPCDEGMVCSVPTQQNAKNPSCFQGTCSLKK